MKKHNATYMEICVSILALCVWLTVVAFAVLFGIYNDIGLTLLFGIFALFWTFVLMWLLIPLVFSTCVYSSRGISLKSIPKRTYTYESFNDIGLGFYKHGYRSSGLIIKYIYFSKRRLPKSKKYSINTIRNSDSFFKVKYSEDVYKYLLDNMPSDKAAMLKISAEENKELLKIKFV